MINYDLPNVPETYVHRIGRTGRAGANGIAFSFCDYEEKIFLKDIQRLIGKTIPVVKDHPFDVPLMHGMSQQASPTAPVNNASYTNTSRRGGGKRSGRSFTQQRA